MNVTKHGASKQTLWILKLEHIFYAVISFEGEKHWAIQKSSFKRMDAPTNQDENLNWELHHQDNKKKKNSFLNQPL